MTVTYERMADFFHKLHLGDGTVLHVFTDADRGDPHDHPWTFTSEVLAGGYVEEVYDVETGMVRIIERRAGDGPFVVPFYKVHRIVKLLEPVTITRIRPGAFKQQPGFWQFRPEGSFRRQHDSAEWVKVSKA